ncbi:MAG: hydrogenase expression/formation protein [Chloroflexi bacterium]|nr:hydrogenase expression/formation protein [Chloroflexota bacterium]
MDIIFPLGKLRLEILARLLARYRGADDKHVILGGAIGEDAAILDIGDRYLVAKTDPITFATDQIGWYAVNVNANDVAVMGATPRWMMATILLPEGKASLGLVEGIFAQMDAACKDLGIALVGGHTEVTPALPRPIVVGTLLGEVEKDRLIHTGNAQPGDEILLVKSIAIEGTAIIARERGDELRARGYSEDVIGRARNFLFDPGISVVAAAQIAAETKKVHAMHDPTEGGLAMGLHELAYASGTGLWVDRARIRILPECIEFCREFGLDPLGLIASGALLVAVPPDTSARLQHLYAQAGIPCSVIGHVTPPEEGIRIKNGGVTRDLPRFDADEITRLF